MVLTVYTSARDVGVKTCAPQSLVRSNFLAEYRTEADKARVRRNLGINEENDLFWGNIQGFIELQKDLIDYIQDNLKYTTETQEGISNIKEALDFIFETIVDYGKHKEDYLLIYDKVESLILDVISLLKYASLIEENFNLLIEQKGNDITSLSENLEAFKLEVSEFLNHITLELLTVLGSILELVDTLTNTVNSFDERITLVEGAFNLKYNTELSDNIVAPNKIGGITAGTTVASLKEKTLIEIVDLLVFPSTVPNLKYPYAYYNISDLVIKVGTSLNVVLNFSAGNAGEVTSETEVITFNNVKIEEFSGYNLVGIYKHIGTISYMEGDYLIDDRGNQTNQRIEAGSVNATLNITTTYPWYINSEELRLVPFNQPSGEISFNVGGTPAIKLPGSGSRIDSFLVDGGSGFLEVNLEGAWNVSEEDINGIPYKVWTKKTAVDSLPYKINFTLLE